MFPVSTATCAEAWLMAANHLRSCTDWRDYTVVLEVQQPMSLPPPDRAIHDLMNDFLIKRAGLSMSTVVNTIFPAGLYGRNGSTGFLETYPKLWPHLEEHPDIKGRWGTYARRITHRKDKNGKVINPLTTLIEKLRKQLKTPGPLRAAYELSTIEPFVDLPIFDNSTDAGYTMGGPCLSHLSFKLTTDHRLMLTAFYRSHYYVQRALGNLYGLAWLQHFVAEQLGIGTAQLVCHSSMAQLDTLAKKEGIAGWTNGDVTGLLTECSLLMKQVATGKAQIGATAPV